MIVKEILSKTVLSKSQIYPYVVNPYTGCQHACSYCYARFMKKFTGHREPWGLFVDVKVNAPDLLKREIDRKELGGKKPARVWVSGVCDPYQPLEKEYQLTRQCLDILAHHGWPVTVQTRSALVLRDLDILQAGTDFQVGLSVTTADDHIRMLFEPSAPPIMERVRTLDELHRAGLRTFVMIAPMLPGAEGLAELLVGKVDSVILDRMNYHYADWVYRKHGLEEQMTDAFFDRTRDELAAGFTKAGLKI